MLTVHFADGTSFAYLEALETEEFYNGASRRTLTITAAADAIGLDALQAALTEGSLQQILLVNDAVPAQVEQTVTDPETGEESTVLVDTVTTVANPYDGYVLILSYGVRSAKVADETPDSPARYESRLQVKLGRRTYIEQQLAALGVAL